MKNRILAFFISNNDYKANSYKKALDHFAHLSERFKKHQTTISIGHFRLSLSYEGDIDRLLYKINDKLVFFVGACYGNLRSNSEIVDNNLTKARDRFVKIELENTKVTVINDYAGTIPVYYSMRNTISLSNIEPVVVLDSNSSYDDISPSGMYGFLRYSHFIWDETLYKHIFSQEPDSQFIYETGKSEPHKKYLQTLQPSDIRMGWNDRQVAKGLYELNQKLVEESLNHEEEIILPLSAGYDSRMILAAASRTADLKKNLRCVTYGPNGSIEVEAAQMLCKLHNIYWQQIDLPCRFLEPRYIHEIGLIFGSALHFHGMYQLEFWDEVIKIINTDKAVITSGFMTGVPAGQHISLLGINDDLDSLTTTMNNFSQSKNWTDDSLTKISANFGEHMIEEAEARFRQAFDRFAGEIYQKSVVFDVWTRQRNFISYHPRTLEWKAPFISPHMTPEYQNFFLSLSKKHATDRFAVELMFKYHYPELTKIVSNGNGLKVLSSHIGTSIFLISQILKKFKLSFLIPNSYLNKPLEFDIPALQFSKKDGLYPVFDLSGEGKEYLSEYFSDETLEMLFSQAISGSLKAYGQLVCIQAVAYGIKMIEGNT